ncbi:FeMo cofactor biosynthesis protein NifB [bioreactor metagenome]|uniref:FeMo cofactor biosynthesis protein NifB n=1 Tax=bioreactor metagenome TaxID=1076179 RepID=A0A645EYM1_9ZZZZ
MQRVAVATSSGILVDQHFGHAKEFYIYESDGIKVKFIEKRQAIAYCTGQSECDDGKDDKIENIISSIKDCGTVLALRIGSSPSKRLAAIGIRSITTYDRIEDAVKKAAGK